MWFLSQAWLSMPDVLCNQIPPLCHPWRPYGSCPQAGSVTLTHTSPSGRCHCLPGLQGLAQRSLAGDSLRMWTPQEALVEWLLHAGVHEGATWGLTSPAEVEHVCHRSQQGDWRVWMVLQHEDTDLPHVHVALTPHTYAGNVWAPHRLSQRPREPRPEPRDVWLSSLPEAGQRRSERQKQLASANPAVIHHLRIHRC